ncbi:phage tail fiber protein [Streptomyces arenae]|uniref:phage tail fiber protein n=1 Tax=Streptomyces arenae TaxID=29301 RepID=UPI00265A4441|nr:hypothetical protein [Streptomyces arenae]MCG7203959.1 hypothetical protein [Streptomyces arenae]
MPLTDLGRAAALAGGLTNAITHISLHTAAPNSAGSNELTGGTYARKSVTWGTPSSGAASSSGQITHDVPASSTVAAYGYWSASTSGNFLGWAPLNGTAHEVATADVTANTLTSPAHGLANGTRVLVFPLMAEALPGGLSAGTVYYVVSSATNTFQLAATAGGSAIDITSGTHLWWQTVIPETYGSAGQLITADGGLTVDLTAL